MRIKLFFILFFWSLISFSQTLIHSSSWWTANNPILLNNQIGQEDNTGFQKIGNGITSWNSLAYYEAWQEYTTASGTDTYICDYKMPTIKGLQTGMRLRVKFTNSNTGICTLNLNGFGAKTIKKAVSTDLSAGDIVAGGVYEFIYDGTNWQAISGLGSTPTSPTSITAGTGILVNQTGSSFTVTNTAPDTGITAGTGISILRSASTNTITNTKPDTGATSGNSFLNISRGANTNTFTVSGLQPTLSFNSPLSVSSNTVSLTNPLPIANGGTNSTVAAGTSGTFLIGDGTRYSPSTLTFPNTITANYIPYATGTNAIGSSANLQFNGTKLGIGMTPSNILDISQSINNNANIAIVNSNTGTGAAANLRVSNGTHVFWFTMNGTSHSAYGSLTSDMANIYCGAPNGINIMADDASGKIIFATGGSSERARINSSGSFIIEGGFFYMKDSVTPFHYWKGTMASGTLTWTDTGSTSIP